MEDAGHGTPPRWLVVTILVAAVVVLAGALLGRDVTVVRQEAAAARASLHAGLEALAAGDLDAATAELADVEASIDRADAATTAPAWSLAQRLPLLSPTLETADRSIDTAQQATAVAGQLVDIVGLLTAEDGTSRLRTPDGRLDLAPVEEAAGAVGRLDTEALRTSLERLRETVDRSVPAVVADGRDEVLDEAGRLLDLTEDARLVADAMPSFLGTEGPREYFLAMQNVGELRGTGGLIGFFATLRVDQGRLELTAPERYEVLDQVDEPSVDPRLAQGLPDGYVERYERNQATQFLGNANLDPHLPSVARSLLNIYEVERGRRLDGVIVMDPIGLAYAHMPVGKVNLPGGVPHGDLPTSISTANLPQILMVDAYDRLGGPSQQRKDYLAAIAETAFAGIASGDWSALQMMWSLSQAAGSGHLQLYSTHEDEQAVFAELDVAGELTVPARGDLLAITAVNAAGNKMDVHAGHRVSGTVTLRPSGDDAVERAADLRVSVVNPLPTEGRDIYIIGSHLQGRGFEEAFTGEPGLNRTVFTLWGPPGTDEMTITNFDGRFRPEPERDPLRGFQAVDYTLETSAESENSFAYGMRGPVQVTARPDGTLRYRLLVHRQAKGIPDRYDLRFTAPEGWEVAPVGVDGGGVDRLFGVDGEVGPQPSLAVDGADVRLTGDVTRDLVVELDLVPTSG